MTKFKSLSLFLFLAVAQISYSQSGPKILEYWWGPYQVGQASFENVKVNVTPLGAYARVELTFELAALDYQNNRTSALEFEMPFTLPPGSIVEDSYLWIFGVPVRASIYERKEAREIYNSYIVRRTDPLLIYKDGNAHMIRIYPVAPGESRKMQISILTPVRRVGNNYEIPTLLHMFKQVPESFKFIEITVPKKTNWGIAQTMKNSYSRSSTDSTDTYIIPSYNPYLENNMWLSYTNEKPKDIFSVQTDEDGNGYFHFMVNDDEGATEPNHYLFIMDLYRPYITGSEGTEVDLIESFKNSIILGTNPGDRIKVIYRCNGVITKNGSVRMSSWMDCSPHNIDSFFKSIYPPSLGTISANGENNIIRLLNDHYLYETQTVKGPIQTVIVSCNTPAAYYESYAADVVKQLSATIRDNGPIHTFEINKRQYRRFYSYQKQKSFNNNEYILSGISDLSGGIHKTLATDWGIEDSQLQNIVPAKLTELLRQTEQPLEVHTNFTYDGFIYDQVSVKSLSNSKQHFLTGKIYKGSGPITVKYLIKEGNTAKLHEVSLQPEKMESKLAEKIWAGNHLNKTTADLKASGIIPTTDYNDVVQQSIKYHVLTDFTSMLALEPDTVGTETEEDDNLSVHEIASGSAFLVNVEAYPNPFTTKLELRFDEKASELSNDWKVAIIGLNGVEVNIIEGSFDDMENIVDLSEKVQELDPGVYMLKVQVGHAYKTIRVMKI